MQKSGNNTITTPEESISRIHGKLLLLLKQYESLQKENDRNKKTIETFGLKLRESEEKINQVEQQNLVLKASISSMSDSDKKELEGKINMYMRSIDKCISLLSK